MFEPVQLLATYLHLARVSQQRRRPHVRDRLLVLAGTLAAQMGLPYIAAYCRHRVLQHNPQHLLGHWSTVEQACEEPDFLHLLRQLRRRYPPERAEQMLASLGLQIEGERATYYSDEEYAAALLDTTPAQLRQLFPDR